MSIRFLLRLAVEIIALSTLGTAQQPPARHDELAEHLAGRWKIERSVMGRAAHHTVTSDWVPGHRFLQSHEQTSTDAPATESRYGALWFLSYDDVSERNVIHLMDVFGARYSETLGYGKREGNELRFVFEYPDGPFHTTFRWLPDQQAWQWLMEQKDKDGKWKPFADFKLTHDAQR